MSWFVRMREACALQALGRLAEAKSGEDRGRRLGGLPNCSVFAGGPDRFLAD